MQRSEMQEVQRNEESMAGMQGLWLHADGPGECLTALCDAVDAGEPWYVVHSACRRLLDALRLQFAVEESLMRIVSYPRLVQHAREHVRVMEFVELVRDASLRKSYSMDGVALRSLVEAHRAGHDESFAAVFRAGL